MGYLHRLASRVPARHRTALRHEVALRCLDLMQSLLAMRDQAVLAAELQKLVLKIFWSATYMGIPALLLQEAQFVGWMTSLLEAVKQPVPQVSPMGSQTGLHVGPSSGGSHQSMIRPSMCALLHPTQETLQSFTKQAIPMSTTQLWATESF